MEFLAELKFFYWTEVSFSFPLAEFGGESVTKKFIKRGDPTCH